MTGPADSLPSLAAGAPATYGDRLLGRRYRLVAPYLSAPARADGATLLDFGCGNGAQTLTFSELFTRIVGVDIDGQYLGDFQRHIGDRGLGRQIFPVRYDGTTVPLADGVADCAVSFTVLEHVADEKRALSELARVLAPGGRLIISVPNRWWIFETHGADLPLLPWNRVPLVSWWPKPLHDRFARARIYGKAEIEAKIAAAGFTVDCSFYQTAPLDMLRWRPLQKLMRRLVFGNDSTSIPLLATEVVVVAHR